jgi:hypothetical protein
MSVEYVDTHMSDCKNQQSPISPEYSPSVVSIKHQPCSITSVADLKPSYTVIDICIRTLASRHVDEKLSMQASKLPGLGRIGATWEQNWNLLNHVVYTFNVEVHTILTAMIFADRARRANQAIVLTDATTANIMIICMLLADKFHNDTHSMYTGGLYKLCGLPDCKTMNLYESWMCMTIGFDFFVEVEEFNLYLSHVSSHIRS